MRDLGIERLEYGGPTLVPDKVLEMGFKIDPVYLEIEYFFKNAPEEGFTKEEWTAGSPPYMQMCELEYLSYYALHPGQTIRV
jgi:hypothetical protein